MHARMAPLRWFPSIIASYHMILLIKANSWRLRVVGLRDSIMTAVKLKHNRWL